MSLSGINRNDGDEIRGVWIRGKSSVTRKSERMEYMRFPKGSRTSEFKPGTGCFVSMSLNEFFVSVYTSNVGFRNKSLSQNSVVLTTLFLFSPFFPSFRL